jgi:general secretion pathway protein A
MYTQFFRLSREPFSISPDPRFLFMSHSHHEALAHLMYGANSGGGVVVLTGEIGAGKTTVCRCFLEQVPENCNVGYIFNPKLTVHELLRAICEEFHIAVPPGDAARPGAMAGNGVKDHIDALNRFLLEQHAQGRNNVLIIDEAQNLAVEVLEQLRLLTNLETNDRKLLQIILIGQPELRDILARPELEQLAQRVIARYHLGALTEQETASYIQHRLSTSGLSSNSPFQQPLMKQIQQLTRGVPRRINLLCDRALLGAYSMGKHEVDRDILRNAANELFAVQEPVAEKRGRSRLVTAATVLAGIAIVAGAGTWAARQGMLDNFNEFIRLPALALKAPSELLTPAPAAKPAARETQSAATPAESRTVAGQAAPAKPAAGAVADAAIPDRYASQEAGLRQLGAVWGVSLTKDAEDPCEAFKTSSLRCYRSEGGLAELRLLDRPALLTIRDGEGKSGFLLLTRLNGAEVTAGTGASAKVMTVAELTRQYRGGFITLWRMPPEFEKPVRTGDSGPHVDWISAQLAKIYGNPKPAEGQPFNENMAAQLRNFQSSQGLYVDGVAGAVTLMHLNRMAGINEPSLQQGMAAAGVKTGA